MNFTRRTMHLYAKPSTFRNAFVLRNKPTAAERILWEHLRKRQLDGVRFRRQHPVQNYVVDFYAHEFKLVIELDGGYHNEEIQEFSDKDREENLMLDHLTILRFANEDVINSLDEVLAAIKAEISFLKALKLQKPLYRKFSHRKFS